MADKKRIFRYVYTEVEIQNISNLHRYKNELKRDTNKKDEELGLSRVASFRMIDNWQPKIEAFFSLMNLVNFLIAKAINGLEFMVGKVSTDFTGTG